MTEHKNWLLKIVNKGHEWHGYYWDGNGGEPHADFEKAGRFTFDHAAEECQKFPGMVEMVNYWAITDRPTTELAAGKIVRHHDEPQQDIYAEMAREILDDHDPEGSFRRAKLLRDYTSAERKAMPVVTGVLHYFPDAIAAVSRVSKAGNDKHNPGEPLHWARGKSNDHIDSLGRHLLTPGAVDPDSGEDERAHRLWRDMADLQLSEEKRLIALGIRPLSRVTE